MSLINYTKEQLLFRDTVREFVAKELRPHALEWEDAGHTPRKIWERCGELGLLGITYPAKYGGLDADYVMTLILAEEMSQCDSPGIGLGISVQTDMATPALAIHGSEELKTKYLAPAIKGEMICSIAVTEPGAGSDVAALTTKAVRDGDHYVINGAKTFITNGTQADFLTLLARTSDAPGHRSFSLFVVPTNTPGFSVGKVLKKTCYPSSDTAEIVLEDVRVPVGNVIGEENKGFIYQMQQFQLERLVGSFSMLGGMKRCYELTKQYIQEREVFGGKLGSFQVTQHKMAQMISEITVVEALAHMCVKKVMEAADFTKEASMLKLIAAQTQQRVTEECVQMHGGYGLMAEYPISRYFRDSKLAGIGGGSNEIMKEIICKYEGLSSW